MLIKTLHYYAEIDLIFLSEVNPKNG